MFRRDGGTDFGQGKKIGLVFRSAAPNKLSRQEMEYYWLRLRYRDAEAKVLNRRGLGFGFDFVVAPEKCSWYKKRRYRDARSARMSFIPTPEPALSG